MLTRVNNACHRRMNSIPSGSANVLIVLEAVVNVIDPPCTSSDAGRSMYRGLTSLVYCVNDVFSDL